MKVVLQDGIKDCGVCCLLSIIRYYGGDVSREYLREITNTTKDGVSFYNLINDYSIRLFYYLLFSIFIKSKSKYLSSSIFNLFDIVDQRVINCICRIRNYRLKFSNSS